MHLPDLDQEEDMSDGAVPSLEDWEDSDSEEDIDLDVGYDLLHRWGDAMHSSVGGTARNQCTDDMLEGLENLSAVYNEPPPMNTEQAMQEAEAAGYGGGTSFGCARNEDTVVGALFSASELMLYDFACTKAWTARTLHDVILLMKRDDFDIDQVDHDLHRRFQKLIEVSSAYVFLVQQVSCFLISPACPVDIRRTSYGYPVDIRRTSYGYPADINIYLADILRGFSCEIDQYEPAHRMARSTRSQ